MLEFRTSLFSLACAIVCLSLGTTTPAWSQYTLHPGDFVIADTANVGGDLQGAIRVLRKDGSVDTLYEGLPLYFPADVAIDRDGAILVSSWRFQWHPENGIYRLDPQTSNLTMLNVQPLQDNFQFVRDSAGDIIVADGFGGLARIQEDGNVEWFSDPSFDFDPSTGIALDYNGDYLVCEAPNYAFSSNEPGYLQSVDAAGTRTVLASDPNFFPNPTGLALDLDGTVLVTSVFVAGSGRTALVRVDRAGNTVDLNTIGLSDPHDVEVVGKGFYAVTDAGQEAVLLRKPNGDLTTVVSEFDDGNAFNRLPVDRPFGGALVPHLWITSPQTVALNDLVDIEVQALPQFAGQEVVVAASENTGPTPMTIWWPGDVQTSHVDLNNAQLLRATLNNAGQATIQGQVPNRPSLVGRALQIQAFLNLPRVLSNPISLPVR